MLFTRYATTLAIATSFVSKVGAIAAPKAEALPWANANPQAFAAANAYADAYAEAVAIAHPDPEAYALAASADDCASIACHASCGLLIIAGQDCSTNSENTYEGPYNTTCLCDSGSQFMHYYSPCMDCGWTLWKYYGGYVSSALAACETLSTEPTGTSRCSTTLTDSYTIDTNMQGCSYLGNCETTTTDAATTSEATSQAATSTSEPATSPEATTSSTSQAAQPTETQEQTTQEQTTDEQNTSAEATQDPTTEASTTSTEAAQEQTTSAETSAEATTEATQEQTSEESAAPVDAASPAQATQGQTTEEPTVPGSASNYPTTQGSAASTFGYFNVSTSVVSQASTTLVTITSCSEDKCTAVESTAQVSIATTTINGVVTSYTTYCPLTTTEEAAPTSAQPSGTQGTQSEAPAASTEATTEASTQASTQATGATASSATVASSPAVTTFEGAAAKVVAGSFFGMLPFLFI